MPEWATDEAFKSWYLLQSHDNVWPNEGARWTQADLDRLTAAYEAYQEATKSGTKTDPPTPPTGDELLAWLRANGSLTDGLEAVKDAFEQQFPGVTVIGPDKVRLADGGVYDLIINYGGENPTWGFNRYTADTGTAAPGATGGVSADFQAWLDRQPTNFYEAPAPFDYPDFVAPEWNAPEFQAPPPFAYEEFVGPTAETFQTDPGYEFRAKEGQRAIENAASARGLLRTPGTIKGLIDWSQGLASQEFGNVWNRAYTGWASNRGAAAEDYDRLWNNLIQDYMVGYNREADQYNRALSTWGANLGKAGTQYGFGLDVAAGKAGGQQGAASLYGNLGLANTGQQQNLLLSLYDLSTRNLPKYTPTTFQSSYPTGA